MTDHAALTNMLPNDLWEFIASFLEEKDLATFKQLCQATLFAGFRVEVGGFLEEGDLFSFRKETGNYDKPLSDSIVTTLLQPLYNRLRAMDDSLPALLPQEGALAFKKAFAKIHKRQQEEIAYFKEHHPLRLKVQDVQVFQLPVSLKALEARNAVLDEINIEIIKSNICLHTTMLMLIKKHLTRFPVALFQEEEYVLFWRNLTNLDCSGNQLTHLNVQELKSLRILWCNKNQLTSLNVQGLKSLTMLWCERNKLTELNLKELTSLEDLGCGSNQLTSLDLQGLASLENLCVGENPLETLNLTGVSEAIKNQYGKLEQSLLAKKLKQADSNEVKQGIIAELGSDSTLNNPLYYYPGLVKDFVSNAPAVIFSAFSSLNQSIFSKEERQEEENPNNKRKRDEGDEENKKRAKKS